MPSTPFPVGITTRFSTPATPEPQGMQKDIFDFFRIQQHGWEDAAVAGGIRDEEQQVAAGDLLCHEHPVGKREHQRNRSPGIAWPCSPQQRRPKETEKLGRGVSAEGRGGAAHTLLSSGSTHLAQYNSTQQKSQNRNQNPTKKN